LVFSRSVVHINKGKWNGRTILPESWVNESLSADIQRDKNSATYGYGYLFWTDQDTINKKPYFLSIAKGNGGQRIFINKDSNLIVVLTAGNYNKPNILNDGQKALDQFILPALQ